MLSAPLAARVLPFSCLVCFSIMKMEANPTSKTSVGFYWTTRGYIPEDTSTLHSTSNPTTCNSSAWQRTEPHEMSEGTHLIASSEFYVWAFRQLLYFALSKLKPDIHRRLNQKCGCGHLLRGLPPFIDAFGASVLAKRHLAWRGLTAFITSRF
jgi:hypothetical protein